MKFTDKIEINTELLHLLTNDPINQVKVQVREEAEVITESKTTPGLHLVIPFDMKDMTTLEQGINTRYIVDSISGQIYEKIKGDVLVDGYQDIPELATEPPVEVIRANTKLCTGCGQVKPLRAFYTCPKGVKGRRSACIECGVIWKQSAAGRESAKKSNAKYRSLQKEKRSFNKA